MRSGYIQRGDAVMPRQGKRAPWQIRNDYFRDAPLLRRGAIEDPVLRFSATRVHCRYRRRPPSEGIPS